MEAEKAVGSFRFLGFRSVFDGEGSKDELRDPEDLEEEEEEGETAEFTLGEGLDTRDALANEALSSESARDTGAKSCSEEEEDAEGLE